jgi:hypothetical protein
MSVNISSVAGAAAQFLDNSGNVLTGGKLFTYLAGTTTPQATYTSAAGNVFHTNPIIFDASGRLPSGGELWLLGNIDYKFVLKNANDVLIGTYDNIPSIPQYIAPSDASDISYEQGNTVTAGAFIIGNTYKIATLGNTNFTSIGAAENLIGVIFVATGVGSGTGTAYNSQTVETKLQQTVSLKDFGAVGNGIADDTVTIQNAITACYGKELFINPGTYKITSTVNITAGITIRGVAGQSIFQQSFANAAGFIMFSIASPAPPVRSISNVIWDGITFDGNFQAVNRWLQNSSRTPITNPQADYYDAITNPTGKIESPSFPAVPAGVCTSNSTNGVLALNGSLVSSGSVNLASIGCRKASITSSGNASNARYTFVGTSFSDTALTQVVIGPNNTTVFSSQVFKTITSVTSNAAPGAAVTVGVRAYDIFSAVADNRRNPNYSVGVPALMSLTATNQTKITNCIFKNIYGRAIFARGNKDFIVEKSQFSYCGKNDGPFHVIYVHEFGNGPVLQDADGIVTSTNVSGNLTLDGNLVNDDGYVDLESFGGRYVSVTSAGNATNITVTIEGTDENGVFLTNSVLGPNVGTNQSADIFLTVTRVVTSGTPNANITVGIFSAGDAFFTPEENPIIDKNNANNLERSFVAFSPSYGGILSNNVVRNWGESCVFIEGDNISLDGSSAVICNNTFDTGVITDIVNQAIEAGAAKNLNIYGNYIANTDTSSLVITGNRNTSVTSNVFKNCSRTYTVPYAPFSERYSFNVNATPIAGDVRDVANNSYVAIGSVDSFGMKNTLIKSNIFVENRAQFPSVFRQTKSGGNFLSSTCVIEGNSLDIPTGMQFLNSDIGSVWETNIPLFIRGNIGHSSEAPVVVAASYTATPSTKSIDVGFRPSKVDVYITPSNVLAGRSGVGTFTWNSAAVRNDFVLGTTTSVSASYNRAGIQATDAAFLIDSSGTVTFRLEFSNWTVKGFILGNPIATEDVEVRYVCYP